MKIRKSIVKRQPVAELELVRPPVRLHLTPTEGT
jgi:hypothetical protein